MPVFFSLLYRNTSLIYCIVANWQSEWAPEGTKNMLSPANALSLVRSFSIDISFNPSEEPLVNKQVGSLALGPVFRELLRWFWKNWAWGVAQHKQLWAGAVNTSWQVRLWWSCAAAGRPPGHCFVSWRKALYWDRLAGVKPPWSPGAKNFTGCGVPDFTAQEMCGFLHKTLMHSLLLSFRRRSSLHDRF